MLIWELNLPLSLKLDKTPLRSGISDQQHRLQVPMLVHHRRGGMAHVGRAWNQAKCHQEGRSLPYRSKAGCWNGSPMATSISTSSRAVPSPTATIATSVTLYAFAWSGYPPTLRTKASPSEQWRTYGLDYVEQDSLPLGLTQNPLDIPKVS